jgi:hypothetical protein
VRLLVRPDSPWVEVAAMYDHVLEVRQSPSGRHKFPRRSG